jgi:DHA1 family tetracycline resistance protein-like MFS transporter
MAKFQLSSSTIGSTLVMSGVSSAIVQGTVIGRVVRRFGESACALFGLAWGALIFVCYAFAPNSWMLYPLLALSGFQGLATPSLSALMSRELGPDRQGELQGGLASTIGLSTIVGPFALTQTLAYFTGAHAIVHFPGAAFVLAAMLACVGFVLVAMQLGLRVVAASVRPAAQERP